MGSSGSHWANVAVEVPISQSNENSPEAISDFMQAHPGMRIAIDLPTTEDSILDTPCYDNSYTLQLDYKDYESWETPDISPEELVAVLYEYDNDYLTLTHFRPITSSDLVNLNLDLIDKFKMTLIQPTYVDTITYDYGDIYYGNINESSSTINLTPYILELLQLPGARLMLHSGGDCS